MDVFVLQKKTLAIEEISLDFCACFESFQKAVFLFINYQASNIISLSAALQDDNTGSCNEMICSLESFLFYSGHKKVICSVN